MHTWYMFLKTGYFLYSIYQNQGFRSHPHVWVAAQRAIFLSFSWAFFYSLSSKPYTFLCVSSFVVKKSKFYINFPMANKNVGLWFKKKKKEEVLSEEHGLTEKKHRFKCRTVESSPEWYIYETLPHLRLGDIEEGGIKMVSARLGSCYETVSPGSIRRYTHKVSSICLPKYELNKNATNGYFKVDNSTPGPYKNNSGQLMNAETRRKSSPGRSTPIRHPVSVKWSVLKNILKSNII